MARLKEIPCLEVTIIADSGARLEEHERPGDCEELTDPHDPRANIPTKHCFVQLQSKAEFYVNMAFLAGFDNFGDQIVATTRVLVDGEEAYRTMFGKCNVVGPLYETKEFCLPSSGKRLAFLPAFQYRSRAEENITDDCMRAKNLSQVEVIVGTGEVYGAGVANLVDEDARDMFFDTDKLSSIFAQSMPVSGPFSGDKDLYFSTQSLARKSKSHCILYPTPTVTSEHRVYRVREETEVARFIFYCRTQEQLEQLMVIAPLTMEAVESQVDHDLSYETIRIIAEQQLKREMANQPNQQTDAEIEVQTRRLPWVQLRPLAVQYIVANPFWRDDLTLFDELQTKREDTVDVKREEIEQE